MDIDQEAYLLRLYLHEYIDRMKPVSLDYRSQIYSERGYIEEGHNGKNFPSFEIWKRIREMFPKDPIKEIVDSFNICGQVLNEIKPEDLIFIPRRDLPIDIFSRSIILSYARTIDKSILNL